MSLFFNGSSGILLGAGYTSGPLNLVLEYPFTISCWFFPTSTTGEQELIFSKATSSGDSYSLSINGTSIRAVNRNSAGTSVSATITSAVTANKWHQAYARFISASSRQVHINGSGAQNGTNLSQTSQVIDLIGIGTPDTAVRPFNGYIAHLAIWNVNIFNSDSPQIGRGVSPLAVRQAGLVAYWPLVNPGQQINIAPTKGRAVQPLPLVPNSIADTPRYSNWNPPVKTVLPTARIYRLPSSIVSGNNVPVLYHQRQQQGMAS